MFLPRIQPLHFGCSRVCRSGSIRIFISDSPAPFADRNCPRPEAPSRVRIMRALRADDGHRRQARVLKFRDSAVAAATRSSRCLRPRAVISNGGGRGSWIRTNDLQYPKLPRYQAALYPDALMARRPTRSRRPQQGDTDRRVRQGPPAAAQPEGDGTRSSQLRHLAPFRQDQWEDSAGDPVSGWISAAIIPLEPGP